MKDISKKAKKPKKITSGQKLVGIEDSVTKSENKVISTPLKTIPTIKTFKKKITVIKRSGKIVTRSIICCSLCRRVYIYVCAYIYLGPKYT
jgi:hypothetical protein